jgi:predicted phosphohydrolase
MSIWAIGDLHLSFGTPGKKMDRFGPKWINHPDKIRSSWNELINHDDLVLIPGDISWASKLDEAEKDLHWIDSLPGTKVLLKGNHDYWWGSLSKVKAALPPSIHVIQNNEFNWNDVSIGGSRLWDSPEFTYDSWIDFQILDGENSKQSPEMISLEKQYEKELHRLELSLSHLNPQAKLRIAMTHYPPIGPGLIKTKTSTLLKKHKIDICLFGHLHSVKMGKPKERDLDGIKYYLTSCDFLDFTPIKIC